MVDFMLLPNGRDRVGYTVVSESVAGPFVAKLSIVVLYYDGGDDASENESAALLLCIYV